MSLKSSAEPGHFSHAVRHLGCWLEVEWRSRHNDQAKNYCNAHQLLQILRFMEVKACLCAKQEDSVPVGEMHCQDASHTMRAETNSNDLGVLGINQQIRIRFSSSRKVYFLNDSNLWCVQSSITHNVAVHCQDASHMCCSTTQWKQLESERMSLLRRAFAREAYSHTDKLRTLSDNTLRRRLSFPTLESVAKRANACTSKSPHYKLGIVIWVF